MNVTQVKEAIRLATRLGNVQPVVPFLRGKPGIGKTDIVRQLTDEYDSLFKELKKKGVKPFCDMKEKGVRLIDVRLSQIDSVDTRGIPDADRQQGISRWLPPEFLPYQGLLCFEEYIWVLFFDEMNRARPDVLQSVFELIRDRRCGRNLLKDNTIIIAAGNLGAEDGCDVVEFDAALKNRFMFLNMDCPTDVEWIEWAREHNILPEIISFIGAHPRYLYQQFEGEERRSVTPRSWEQFSNMCTNNADRKTTEQVAMLIGNSMLDGAAPAFLDHLKSLELISAKDVLENYDKVKKKILQMPRDRVYQMKEDFVSAIVELGERKTAKHVANFDRFCKEILTDEVMVAMLKHISSVNDDANGPALKAFRKMLWDNHPDTSARCKKIVMSQFDAPAAKPAE